MHTYGYVILMTAHTLKSDNMPDWENDATENLGNEDRLEAEDRQSDFDESMAYDRWRDER